MKVGPSAILAIVIAGLSCYATCIAYAEFATKSSKSGSSYSYIYKSMGEIFAFLIGCSLMYSLILGSAAIARSWSDYFVGYISSYGVSLPSILLDNDINSFIVCFVIRALMAFRQ